MCLRADFRICDFISGKWSWKYHGQFIKIIGLVFNISTKKKKRLAIRRSSSGKVLRIKQGTSFCDYVKTSFRELQVSGSSERAQLDEVQKKATKMTEGMSWQPYKERLKRAEAVQ